MAKRCGRCGKAPPGHREGCPESEVTTLGGKPAGDLGEPTAGQEAMAVPVPQRTTKRAEEAEA